MIAGAVIVAAGRGERFGANGKIMVPLAGRPMLAWSLDAIEAAGTIRDVVLVVGEHTEAPVRTLVEQGPWSKVGAIVLGGAQRHESVQAGVRALTDDVEVAVIHDAARPLAAPDRFDACARVAAEMGGAILAVPVTDTVKRVGPDGVIVETVDRASLWAAQTPQAFRREQLLEAWERSSHDRSANATDEAMLFERMGWPVRLISGSRENLKVTLPEDLMIADFLLRSRKGIS